jgi:hypothetical protein
MVSARVLFFYHIAAGAAAVAAARRLECYNCSSSRPSNPKRVTMEMNEPSTIVKVSGIEPQTR